MPLPLPSDAHVNQALTQMSVAFRQQMSSFVSFRAFPAVNVDTQTNAYYVWDRADFHRDEAKPVGPGGEAPISALRLSTDTYSCVVNKLAHLVTEEDLANQDPAVNLQAEKTEDLVRKLMIRKEKDWASKYFTTGKWGTDLVSGANFTAWSTAGSTPVKDIRTQITNLKKLGLDPQNMVLVCGAEVWAILQDHSDFIGRYQYSQAAIMAEADIARVLGIGEVVVPNSVENTAAEGATASMSFIHGKSALLVYRAPRPALGVPSGGYSFVWTGLVGAASSGIRVKTFERPEKSALQVQGESAWDHKVVSSACGVFFSAAVA